MHFGSNVRRLFFLPALVAAAGITLPALGCGSEEPSEDESEERDAGSETGQPASDAGQGGSENGSRDAGQGSVARDGGGALPQADGGGAGPRDAGNNVAQDAGGGGKDAGSSAAKFSFFMTSQAGLERLSGNDKGFGGDLRFGKADGLSGADEICRQLAESAMPGNGKTWRAFLSVTKGPDGTPVNAIDRVGEGPWYDRQGRVFAMNKQALLNTRPAGADPVIVNDFPNEDGVPNHNPGTGIIDNHNTLTGSTAAGVVDSRGLTATCQDWTSAQASGGKPRCGVSWPRGPLSHWISTLDEGGCAPGATPPGAEAGERGTVGALGGYGGFYCFALTP